MKTNNPRSSASQSSVPDTSNSGKAKNSSITKTSHTTENSKTNTGKNKITIAKKQARQTSSSKEIVLGSSKKSNNPKNKSQTVEQNLKTKLDNQTDTSSPAETPQNSLTLRVENLIKKYGKRTVVEDVSFYIRQGEVVGLLGPNGAGKTTSFYMTVGLVNPTKGKIFLNQNDITHVAMYKRARMGLGYLAQEASIFRKLTVRENIEAILEIRKLNRKDIKTRTDQLLKELEIEHVQNQQGITLSGGERRRAEIARTLASDPKFILLDEPFAGVDPIAVKDIQKVVQHLKAKNIGILITDHNVRETLKITDRSYILFQGKILIEGDAEALIKNKKAREIYLGEDFAI